MRNQPSSDDPDGSGPGRWEKEPEAGEEAAAAMQRPFGDGSKHWRGHGRQGENSDSPSYFLGVIALFCRQYDIIKDNEPNNNKEKTKSASETSTPEHQGGGLLRSKVRRTLWLGGWPCALNICNL